RPEGFDREKYEHDLPGSDIPVFGAIPSVVSTVLDVAQRARLAGGLTTRPAGNIPHTNADSYEHPELKRMIDDSKADQVHELGQMWNDLGNEIMDFGASLQRTANNSEAIWAGQAGNAARTTLNGLATWSQDTGQGVQYMGTTMRTQAEAAQVAKTSMPEPVSYNPAEYQDRMNSTINPIEWVQILGDAHQQADRHNTARAEAVRVIETYSTSLHDTSGTMPAFAPPQEFGSGDTGLTPGAPMPGGSGGGSGGGVPVAGGVGGGAPGGVPSIGGGGTSPNSPDTGAPDVGTMPPSSTPGQAAPHAPSIPGGPGGSQGPAPSIGAPGFVPAAAAGIGGAGAGTAGRGSGISGGRGAGGFGPRGSGGLGASNAMGRGGFGSAGAAGAAESAVGAGKGAAGMAGRGPGGGAFAPMAGGARGQGSDESEHRRPSYLVETEDIWGDGRRVAPP
ncbi:MAG: hypothetical protein ACRDRM_05045, partial [Pseudonocardiaceae bacterium]